MHKKTQDALNDKLKLQMIQLKVLTTPLTEVAAL